MKTESILISDIYAPKPKKINKHIEIVGSSAHDLGSMGKKSRQLAYDVLRQYYSKVGITVVDTLTDLEALVALRPDLVFLGVKYIPLDAGDPRGQSRIWLSSYLDERGIAYTGSDQNAHLLEVNKSLAKQRVLEYGLKTSPFYVAKQNQPNVKRTDLSFPLFVKPTDRGGGQGIDDASFVRSSAQLQSKIDNIKANLQADALVEEFLPGREFSVAILKNEFGNDYSVMPVELVAQADEYGVSLLSGEVKSSNTEIVSAMTDITLKTKVCTLALTAFHALEGRDYGRIDIRLDASGQPNFLEANLLPSLIEGYGSFPKACLLNIKLNYEDMILSIVALGLERDRSIAPLDLLGTVQDQALISELADTVQTA